MSASWLVETRLRSGTLVSRMPFHNLQFEKGFNGPYGIRCSVPLYHPQVTPETLSAGLHELWVRRNGVVVAAGPLWDVVASTDQQSLTLTASSLEDYLDVRIVKTNSFTAVDQTSIAWSLIAASQAETGGGLGFTSGTLGTGITRSLSWLTSDAKYVMEAIQDISDLAGGFDWWIDPATRQFNAIYPRPQVNRGLTLVYPKSISSYAVQYYGKYMRNQVIVQGPEPYSVTANTPASITTYGLRELGDSYMDAEDATGLSAYASKLRDLRASVKNYPTIVCRSQTVDVFDPTIIQYGDLVKLYINDGYVQFNSVLMRYGGCQVTVAGSGEETIVLYMQDQRELT